MIEKKQNSSNNNVQEKTIFGSVFLEEPVLINILKSKPMQRLKNIHQYGVSFYSTAPYPYSRYEHSLGVFHLLHKAQVSLKEQIAGLLHDVSHTVFSHVGDLIFNQKSATNSYQDDIHEWYINQTEIPEILDQYGFSVTQILHKNKTFTALEQDLPHLCADRIEYLLHGALLINKISSQDLSLLYQSLHFENQQWYFSDLHAAKQLAYLALYLTEHNFTAPWNIAGYYWAADALKYALEKEIITFQDIHFSHDELIWQKLHIQNDQRINTLLNKVKNSKQEYKLGTENDYDLHVVPRFRAIDPLVLSDRHYSLEPLSAVDAVFAQDFLSLKNKIEAGWYLKLS